MQPDRRGPTPPDEVEIAAAPRSGWGRRLGTLARDTLEAVVLALVLFAVLQVFVQNTVVEGDSMEPNFVDREHLLVSKMAYRWGVPARGDVVVFHAPELPDKDYIKRVIGLPGEIVELRRGEVYVDGAPIEEPWLPRADRSSFGPYAVPAGHVFVLGDNRAYSNDSRAFGRVPGTGLANPAVPMELVVGRAWVIVWPIDRVGLVGYGLTSGAGS
jgi:signal peptidase I